MSTTTFTIEANRIHNPELEGLEAYMPGIEITSYAVGLRRGGLPSSHTRIAVEDDTVIVAEFDNNIKWFYDKPGFIAKVKQQQPAGRSISDEKDLQIPLVWQDEKAATRGVVSGMLKLLGINVVKKAIGKSMAESIAARIEEKNGNIVYQCDKDFNLVPYKAAAVKDPQPHYLLLLHGTGSSTLGSFLGLKKEQNGKVYDALFKKYNGNVLAYEHRTFTQSPVQNVADLLQLLPDHATLDLISHSRGGLVGEVLARIGKVEEKKAFSTRETELLAQNEEAAGLLEEISALHALLAQKEIRVERFVRVACPAAGTTLVSERMDNLLNVLFNIVSNMPGEVVSAVGEGLKALVMAVVDEKNDPGTLPGIQCMKPDSDFIKVLNFKETQIDSELYVIAGDAIGEGFVNRMKMFLVDAFYREDNDLVVNTASMKRGTARKKPAGVFDERNGNVSHFNYFINSSSQNIIYEVLLGALPGQGRGAIVYDTHADKEPVPLIEGPVSRSGKGIADQPVLYVLPGIMGSHLQEGGDRIWLNYLRMATGGLSRLNIDAPAITASGINGSAYGDFVQYFGTTHYVIPYAYDWRRSIFDAADKLNAAVLQSIEQTRQTISFMVHSMGGLVLRAFAVKYPDTWTQLSKRSNFRVLMLGTPNQGSYDIPRILLGIGKNINLVALLDITHSKKALLRQFVRYPGLLNLLPAFGDIDFSKAGSWDKMMAAAGPGFPVPQAGDLASFSEMLGAAFRDHKWDPAVVKYIAGKDELTAVKMEMDAVNKRVDFFGTPRGDGSVTWDSIPAELKAGTYYIPSRHGDMAAHKASYAGYRELLENGATRLLSMVEPATRGDASRTELMPQADPVVLTTEAEMSKLIMGMEVVQPRPDIREVNISLTHGDMGHALYPVMVGHFVGDGILQAEMVLNRKLDNYFSIRHEANNYPGRIGTHEIVIKRDSRPSGGIVVGLGDFGELTENTLYTTLKQALLSYITRCRELGLAQGMPETVLGISTLLIGSDFGGLTIYSCIRAMLMAIQDANRFFDPARYPGYPYIGHLEIVELYQHKAVQAARIVGSLVDSSGMFSGFVFRPDIIKKVSGSQNRIPDDIQTDWWHRLKVYESDASGSENSKTRLIRFSSITDKARSEEDVLAANINIVDQLIAKTAAYSRNEPGLCETLYEMLIPYSFKGYGSDLRNIVLIVDKETARYPWEMLRDAHNGSADPIVTKAGFIRQLSTTTYRINTELSKTDNALVIGNPVLNGYYPSLPGAGAEAGMVADLLKERGFDTSSFINAQGADAILSLYSKPFKILHIAAHGVVNDKTTGQTGVVMGPELIMTPSDFKQIRYVPELVFINCCSLGVINKEDEERLQRKFQVAAGVGTQLVEMGAKAVIVAGWEVDDVAAKCFSDTFYRFMLDGKPYGEAVRMARKITWENYPQVNTWGAYQCYGDPFYTLRNSASGNNTRKERYYDIVEAVDRLETFISKLEAATAKSFGVNQMDKLTLELEGIIRAIALHEEWKDEAVLLSLIADAYKELDLLEKAIVYYEQLFSLENAAYTFRTVEQYCNTNIKYTVERIAGLSRAGEALAEDQLREAQGTIDNMIAQLNGLGLIPTAERLSMLASGYKAKTALHFYSSMSAGYDFADLVQAARLYRKSYEQFRRTKGIIYYYPLYNWLQLAAVLKSLLDETQQAALNRDGVLDDPDDLPALALRSDAEVLERETHKPDFWNKTSYGTASLLGLLKATSEEEVNRLKKAIIAVYQDVFRVEGSLRKIRAVGHYFGFLVQLLDYGKDASLPIKQEALREIKEALDRLD